MLSSKSAVNVLFWDFFVSKEYYFQNRDKILLSKLPIDALLAFHH